MFVQLYLSPTFHCGRTFPYMIIFLVSPMLFNRLLCRFPCTLPTCHVSFYLLFLILLLFVLYALIFYSQKTLAPVQNNFPPSPHSLRPIFVASVSTFCRRWHHSCNYQSATLCAYDINAQRFAWIADAISTPYA